MTQKQYAKAPIAEAVIDIQTREPVPMDRFDAFQDTIKNELPTKHPIRKYEVGLLLQPDGAASKNTLSPEQVGWRLTNASDSRVLQLQQRAFTYSHLPPYTHWEQYVEDARQLWGKYISAFEPSNIARFAVRYINRITIPQSPIEISDFFNLYPSIPEMRNTSIAGLFMQLQIPQVDIMPVTFATISMGQIQSEKAEQITFLLDIDIAHTCDISSDSEELWVGLGLLRDRKNQLFEDLITDSTRELIS